MAHIRINFDLVIDDLIMTLLTTCRRIRTRELLNNTITCQVGALEYDDQSWQSYSIDSIVFVEEVEWLEETVFRKLFDDTSIPRPKRGSIPFGGEVFQSLKVLSDTTLRVQ